MQPVPKEHIKKSTANRRAQRGSGLTGLTVEFQLVHLQNIAIQRDRTQAAIENAYKPELKAALMELPGSMYSEILSLIGALEASNKILDFIVQKDFESPIDGDLWGYDPQDRIPASAKY